MDASQNANEVVCLCDYSKHMGQVEAKQLLVNVLMSLNISILHQFMNSKIFGQPL
jgi:hypothetical protein